MLCSKASNLGLHCLLGLSVPILRKNMIIVFISPRKNKLWRFAQGNLFKYMYVKICLPGICGQQHKARKKRVSGNICLFYSQKHVVGTH